MSQVMVMVSDAGNIVGLDMMVDLGAPFDASTLPARYLHKNNKLAGNADSNRRSPGCTYSLSMPINFYTSYAKVKNAGLAPVRMGGTSVAVHDSSAFNIGIRDQI